jgi:hypothetical protein
MTENPILITGVYRSGTTILTSLLKAHTEIDIGHPSVQYFRYIIKKDISPSFYKNIVNSISERIDFRYKIKLDTNRIIDEIEQSSKKEVTHKIICDCVMRALHLYSGKRWGEKSLLEWTNIPTFLEMFPSGKTIHIIRDPRDVIASYKNVTYEVKDNYLDAIFNCLSSMQHAIEYSSTFSEERYLLVKFEDLVNNRLGEIEKICKYLNIEFNESDYAQENIKEGVGEGSVELTLKTHSAFPESDFNSFKRWESKLSLNELEFSEVVLSSVMDHFGYQLSDNFSNYHLNWLLNIFKDNELINDRFIHYLKTGKGVEEYPSDPTNPKNWSTSTISQGKELGKGAANAYKKMIDIDAEKYRILTNLTQHT